MVGFGGAIGTFNPPAIGPVKYGFGRILTFALGATAPLTVSPYGHRAPPSSAIELRASAATLKEGAALFESFCAPCHGFSAIAGPIADLRYATADVHRAFEAIVLGGALEQRGMPSFGDLLTTDQARAIQAYVLSRAAEASKGR